VLIVLVIFVIPRGARQIAEYLQAAIERRRAGR
jgi:hypothetical protein